MQCVLQVLSHNLCTVLCIPHDPAALEEHFRDDDDGPVSSQGYMPYLNKYILDKVLSHVPKLKNLLGDKVLKKTHISRITCILIKLLLYTPTNKHIPDKLPSHAPTNTNPHINQQNHPA